jgi:hypothetical protein
MKNQKGDILTYFGTAIFIVLFFLVISAFSKNSGKQTNDVSQIEFVSELHTTSVKAVIADAIQLPVFQKKWVSLLDKMSFKLYHEMLKISADNNKIAQRIFSLRKIQILLKPVLLSRFYYFFFSINPEDLPVLS